MQAPVLYLVHLDPAPEGDGPAHAFALAPGLYLVESWETRSRLYHAVKHRFRPRRLLVAPLADVPKFHGMAPGALKWVRTLG
ncbi:hypothetical protein CO641_00090 [Lysobacteraceae bacterium NML91-0213]|nr:hypothetical protein CO641_00090 [Xanthomonadaceae bacterium NML91-0213]